MSWALLILGGWCALHALNAWRPVRRNRVLYLWSFFASWLTIEGAPLWLVAEAVAAGLLVWGGALGAPAGWVGLVLLVGSWLYQLGLILQVRATGAIATTAMGDFGLEVLAGRPVDRRGKVRIERNIVFRRVAGRELKLDVYRPRTEGEQRPAILQIHGGAWVIGDKREQGIPLLKYLASRGWVGFNANYRLSPGATFPDQLVDLKAALAWIRAHAEEYGVDPDFVVVTGGSAGGHLTALMALTANQPRYQPGFEEADTSVAAAVPFYGIYDFTNRNDTMPPEFHNWIARPLVIKAFIDEEPERYAAASPIDQIHPDAPPFLIVHGDKDTLAPVADARTFAHQLAAVSHAQVVYVELKGAQHAFDVFGSPRTRRMIQATEAFLFAVHQDHLHHREPMSAPKAS